jgi:hypothetical protein
VAQCTSSRDGSCGSYHRRREPHTTDNDDVGDDDWLLLDVIDGLAVADAVADGDADGVSLGDDVTLGDDDGLSLMEAVSDGDELLLLLGLRVGDDVGCCRPPHLLTKHTRNGGVASIHTAR